MTEAAHTTLGTIPRDVGPRPVRRSAKQPPPASPRRVYMVDLMRSRGVAAGEFIAWIGELGFDTLLLGLPPHFGTADVTELPPIAEAAAAAGLRVHVDLTLDLARESSAIVSDHPDWFRSLRGRAADPREMPVPDGLCALDLRAPAAATELVEYWTGILRAWSERGITGYRCKPSPSVPSAIWRDLIADSDASHFSIWTPGLAAADVDCLPRDCFDLTYNSLAWWNFGAGWFRDEVARLSPIGPVANTVGLPDTPDLAPAAREAAQRLLGVAASNGLGLLLPMGFEFGLASDLSYPEFGADDWRRLHDYAQIDLTAAVRQANRRLAARDAPDAPPEIISGDDAPVAVLYEAPAQLTLANRHLRSPARFDLAALLPMLDGKLAGFAPERETLAPGEVVVLAGAPVARIVTARPREAKRRLTAATAASRVVIEAIEPGVDGGRFAAKRVVGERVTVAADVLADGHGKIAAALQWRAGDQRDWHEVAMRSLGNDRWSADFLLERVGPYVFRIVAWPDRFATWRDELGKKHAAGIDVTLELEEGRLLVEAMAEAAPGTLDALVGGIKVRKGRKAPDRLASPPDRLALLMDDTTAAAIARADTRPGQIVSAEMPVSADRRAAEFASWYELFPRNMSDDTQRHGTFRDVISRLPAIRDMGFDVLYFPPIHPIGTTNRKGRDNTLTPADDDPGSPYAIGSAEGGHDAIHPELGTIDDFRALRDAASEHGLELALDFAIQCSPDHPWLKQHPEWFDWRPDGGLRYAENPPKKYEDIVNVDFYSAGAIPSLWLALRDVVAYWAGVGVRIFRVDNPHTKPFAFWEWLIADIRASWPDTLFLAEAFTRPKVMYRLAKLGFTQSYTYFTWRNEKWEIEAYLRELTGDDVARIPPPLRSGVPEGTRVADFFRPNFFVNTPDINPVYLQHAGRAGFLIRAALAGTLSGLWGMLQGFEFCEASGLPGREEYAHSDKYEIRLRPERAPGDIVDEITRLNMIRRANPALQSHRGLAFHNALNDRVLWFRKANVDRSNVVLVAISLDPFAPQTADVEVPLWEWGLSDDAAVIVDDLMRGGSEVWTGKIRTISLDPRTMPFGIWRARPLEAI
jgi:starch synthase (maltosyl-transferring)